MTPEHANMITPGGAQTMSKRHDRYGAGMPAFNEGGHGPYAYDEHGRPYIDWIAGLATVTLGHAHPDVVEAIQKQSRRGGTFSMPHPLEAIVGERFLRATGWDGGQIRWVSTGSEATEGAVRIARMATGRDRILSIGYHGWHSTWTAAKPSHPGVPAAFARVITDLPHGNLTALDTQLNDHVAAVILEPCTESPPDGEYLQAVVNLAHHHGALVISDEIICGFRWHVRGAMYGTCGVKPDLVCFGKAIANGAFPIAAIVGETEYMRHAWPVSGTANGHPVGLAAVAAVLSIYENHAPIERIHANGRSLRRQLAALAEGRPWCVVGGDDPRPVCRVVIPGDAALSNTGQTLLCQALADRGVLWHPAGAGNAMVGHERVFIDTVRAFEHALEAVDAAMLSSDPSIWLRGAPSRTDLAVRE